MSNKSVTMVTINLLNHINMHNNIPLGYDDEGNRLPFSRHFDIEEMLYEDAQYLIQMASLPIKTFLKTAKQLDLRGEDWSMFWDSIRTKSNLKLS